ncbi:phosphopantothenoylcysteine decarboxylase subunit VHS3-like [Arachis stenosperma]|uniref:phosphopantothenoylcysteine decarboxylase subunit VHS3-like n=1 Tax=Arachis stenosperma TaxID=217475 RepID=UPI0025AC03E4|nr:phosphopantothenoylcysteine decarboxylase subunit VHS3-like [Arachis stenosperma]
MAPVPGQSHSGNYEDIPTNQRAHPSGIAAERKSTAYSDGSNLERYKVVDDEDDDYLVDHPHEDEDEDEDVDDDDDDDEDDNNEPASLDDEDRGTDSAPSACIATGKKEKGFNLRANPSHQSANQFTPSAFNKVANKCKKLYKDVK